MADFDLRKPTPKGYQPYELMSAMQKFIRRSMEQEAMFCFLEMEGAGFYHIIKNRLIVTIYEDVGMGNIDLVNSIQPHIQQMDAFYTKKNGAWRLVLSNIILQACRGKKTRIADNFVSAIAAKMCSGWLIDFDEHDFVYDMHTRKGRQMGRGYEHFDAEASKIVEATEFPEYRDMEIEIWDMVEANGIDVWKDYGQSTQYLSSKNDKLI